MYASHRSDDLNGWIAEIGTMLARVGAPDPVTDGVDHRTGTVLLAFTMEPDGAVEDIRVAGSSGDDGLDRRAIAKLRRAAPLPAGPPCAARRTQVVAMRVAERMVPHRRAAAEDRAYA